jgi:hypothetical protein
VVISTDHDDHEAAVKSVSGQLKRTGYDVLNFLMEDEANPVVVKCHAQIEACEPEVNPRGSSSN